MSRRLLALAILSLSLCGCREVRVRTYSHGTTTVPGGNQIAVVRDSAQLEAFGIRAPNVKFRHEFGVVLVMGPHRTSGWKQVIESIRANDERVRIVAFERPEPDGGTPAREYRTFTLWIIPNSVYRSGDAIEVVTPSGEAIASTSLP
jgi:hypothetical protein